MIHLSLKYQREDCKRFLVCPKQTCYPLVGIVYNPMPLPFLYGSTVLLMDEKQPVELFLEPFANQLPIYGKYKFGLVSWVFHHLKTCSFSFELPLVFLRIEFTLIEQRLAADEHGSLSFVEADFKAELFHVHQFLEQRKPCLCF